MDRPASVAPNAKELTLADPNDTAPEAAPQEEERDSSLTLKGGMALPSVGFAKGSQAFLGDVRGEFKKITWPTRQQVLTETGVVLVVVTALSLLILFLDWLFALIANRFLV